MVHVFDYRGRAEKLGVSSCAKGGQGGGGGRRSSWTTCQKEAYV